jgi:hypothetical protein
VARVTLSPTGAAGVVRKPVDTVGPEYEKAVAELIVAIRAAHPMV